MNQLADNTKTRITTLAVAGILVLSLFISGSLFPGIHIFCIHYHFTGIQCPLCGLTRATNAFFHLHFGKALQYNPAIFLLVAFFIAESLDIFRTSQRTKFFRKFTLIALIGGALLIYIFRIIGHYWV